MGEIASTKLLLSTTRPGPFISGSSHAILTLGQRPVIGAVLCEASWLAGAAHVAGGIFRSIECQWCLLVLHAVSPIVHVHMGCACPCSQLTLRS